MDNEIRTSAEAEEAAALPRRYEVDAEKGECAKDLPTKVSEKPIKNKSAAEWAYERLILYIQNFEKQLDNEHEIAMGFTGGNTGVLRIEGMGFFDPDMVTFYGTDTSGAKTQLVQHVSQLNVTLRALPKQPETAEPKRIGFRLAQDLDENT
ncbi:DUF6173 family protein [Cognatishimia sp. SS12]|uniref:DUF6173 family protein n=1 Tax=Cognatishimia sp. SS12 TaxID=2979465 RepID=UPI0023300764|nr:DUF6173 family protein [Cognatishimia sp. SS12]MDC0739089.1 DUF6173 family protein [Cognatishimia sp. SS12]